jgi:hypothetical protein
MLFRTGAGVPLVYPLGSAIAADGQNTEWQPAMPHHVVLTLPISPTIPEGDYQFVHRSFYLCSWLGGLIQHHLNYQSRTLSVRVGLQ